MIMNILMIDILMKMGIHGRMRMGITSIMALILALGVNFQM